MSIPHAHKPHDLKLFLPFIGIGSGGLGFLDATPKVDGLAGRWRVIGGIDSDAGAVKNAQRLLGAHITLADLFSREQYTAFHGHEPPPEWRELTPADIRAAAGNEVPDLIFSSPPCKGYSGLLAESVSKTAKYQALNELALRAIWLCLEAFKDDLPKFFLIENVPRMLTRGRVFLDRIRGLFLAYGFAVAETVHDCGEIGNLAQSRKRFLGVARNMAKVPNYLYQPPRNPLRAVGEVLGRLPVPGTSDHPMHRLPNLQWKTWVRLAFVQAGSDWRSLKRLRVVDGMLADYALVPERQYHNGAYGVQVWGDFAGTMTGNGRPASGVFSVADPRFDSGGNDYGQYGVNRWESSTGAMINVKSPGQGWFSIADPRLARTLFNHAYRVVRFEGPAKAVTSGECHVADPRAPAGPLFSKYGVAEWNGSMGTVIARSTTGQGTFGVADPRPAGLQRKPGDIYASAGAYGVVPWRESSTAIAGAMQHDNGRACVADPRIGAFSQTDANACLPEPNDKLACVIVAEDGTWHRPFTTLETAALQSIFEPEHFEDFGLTDGSDGTMREWIGNAVPRRAGRALGEVFGHALLLSGTEQTFILSSESVWVRQQIAAIQCGATA
jgi:site-specific DNA-cytosine methylase